jgi:nitrite reductase/ring-hydroxylating ferredoxin subunit/uncharacterized membrane protein
MDSGGAAVRESRRPGSLGKSLASWLEEREQLDGLQKKLSGLVSKALDKTPDRQKAADLLNGTWLGHPLHPVLTAVPIGAWTFAGLLDALSIGRRRPSAASTASIAFGVAAAAPTAAAGAADWQHLSGGTSRVGLGHALLNSAALLCYSLSLLFRLSGHGPARFFSFAGLGIASVSAYLGGHLVFGLRVGVKRASEAEPPDAPQPLLSADDLPDGQLKRVDFEGYPIVLLRRGGRVYAMADICPHLACSLSEGKVEGDAIVCTCHGSTFSLLDGSVLKGPSAFPVDVFVAHISGNEVFVGRRAQESRSAQPAFSIE